MKRNTEEFRERYKRWKNGENYWDVRGIPMNSEPNMSDKEYADVMERVAESNNPAWNRFRKERGQRELTPDEEYLRVLNDNSYDYRSYYNNNPQSKVNADTHWPDTYKAAWHPTFSNESRYSGKVSEFNPAGITGGTWIGDTLTPTAAQALYQNGLFGW